MNITVHGAGQEVGRSCIEIMWHDKRILLDCGIKINKQENVYPTSIEHPEQFDVVFLSHAHLDHTGALPWMYHQGLHCPIFTTQTTKEITHLMLKDSWKIDRIEQRHTIYAKSAIKNVINAMVPSAKGVYKGIEYKLIPSGHIPGSAAIHLTYKGETLLYTGDINGTSTQLLKKYKPLGQADVLITESTYGNRQHVGRNETEKTFKKIVQDTIDRGGSVLVAAFAIGRSQEMMLLLDQMKLRCPIYLDGMSKAVTQIFLRHPDDLKNRDLEKATKRIDMVTNWDRRKSIQKKQGVFIATSGMLDGGPILEYIKGLAKDHRNTLILTGYQAEDSNGRLLLEKGYLDIDGKTFDVVCPVHHLNFSAHAGEAALHQIIDEVQPKHVIAVHGEEGSTKSIVAYAKSKGMEGIAPKTGSAINIEG